MPVQPQEQAYLAMTISPAPLCAAVRACGNEQSSHAVTSNMLMAHTWHKCCLSQQSSGTAYLGVVTFTYSISLGRHVVPHVALLLLTQQHCCVAVY